MTPETLPNKVADQNVIRNHKTEGLMLEEGTDTIIGPIEKIIFRNIKKVPWSAGKKGENITGEVEFYQDDRCFYDTSERGFPNTVQFLQERGDSTNKKYFVSISGYELSQIYDESNLLD